MQKKPVLEYVFEQATPLARATSNSELLTGADELRPSTAALRSGYPGWVGGQKKARRRKRSALKK
jgi:hypothetical protein